MILTPDNVCVIGFTREPSTKEYYLVFYHEILIRPMLNKIIQSYEDVNMRYMEYSDFDEIKQIGSGGYGTVYTAKYRKYSEVREMQETVVLKRFKDFDETPELFINEVSNNNW